jgi:SAM-dependent MidA family methyltransferase
MPTLHSNSTEKHLQAGRPELVSKLAIRMAHAGPLSFAEFMEAALYDPEFGYYTTAPLIGRDGDYCTSPETHPIFAELIGKQIAQAAEAIASSGEFTLVEMGAGRGSFAEHILHAYRRDYPRLLARLRYVIIERSPSLIRRQQEQLASLLRDGLPIRWLPSLAALPENSVTGVMFSNELVDAFPVHRVVKRALGLREIFVGWDPHEQRFIEIEAPPVVSTLDEYFGRLGIQLEDGQRADVNLEALTWMRDVGGRLRNGLVITIDYGHTARDLFAPIRKTGTFLCYYRQTVADNPYVRVGYQDMTAHVDFTSLALTGKSVGLAVTGFTNQLNFLVGLGIEAAFAGVEAESAEAGWMRSLLRPEGMGGTYKVLVQHKGIEAPLLDGLRFRPFLTDALFTGLSAA